MQRILSRWDSMAISIGIVVGIGIFRVPSEVAKILPQGGLVILLAWVAGAIVSFVGALCYAELATRFPETGGDYIFLREAYGKAVAFAYAWTEIIIIRTGSIAAMALLLSEYLTKLVPSVAIDIKLAAMATVVILAASNLAGIVFGKTLQNVLTVAKLAAVVFLIGSVAFADVGHWDRVLALPSGLPSVNALSAFGIALIPILWTYGGWHEGAFVAGETKDAKRSLPFALLGTVILISSIYVAANAAFLHTFSSAQMAHSPLLAADIINRQFGSVGGTLLAGLVVVSTVGSINALIITSSRVVYAVAADIPALKWISSTSSGRQTPVPAIIITAIGSCILIALGSFDRLLFFTGIVVWLFFALVAGSIFIFRRRTPITEQQFSVPFYPLLPLIFACACLALSLNTAVTYTEQSFYGIALTLSSMPVYGLLHLLGDKATGKSV